jgi:hypothetical protein
LSKVDMMENTPKIPPAVNIGQMGIKSIQCPIIAFDKSD